MATDTQEEIKKLEARLEELKAAQIAELKERLAEAFAGFGPRWRAGKKVIRDLENEIENLSSKSTHEGRRRRTSPAESVE